MTKNSKIFVAGGTGFVGNAIIRNLVERGYINIVSSYHNRRPFSHIDKVKWVRIDLTRQQEVEEFFMREKPEYVVLAAAKVGGIWANNVYRADFIYTNLQIQNNVIYYSYKMGVKKLVFLGSTCVYPKNSPQPIKEEYLLTSPLEYTNEPYAIAKISGIKMCESFNLQYGTNFISVMPTNLYGPHDNFDLETSHVLAALLRKIHLGKLLENDDWDGIRKDLDKNPIKKVSGHSPKDQIIAILNKYGVRKINDSVHVEVWGTGKPKREFLWIDDMADAVIFVLEKLDFIDIIQKFFPESIKAGKLSEEIYTTTEIRNTQINIGTGEEISIKDLAHLIKKIVGFGGYLYFNTSMPDGTPRKLSDISRISFLGWKHKITLTEGLTKLYDWYAK